MRALICVLALVALPATAAGPLPLNDTGIDVCHDNNYPRYPADCVLVAVDGGSAPRQDARFGRDAQAKAGTLAKIGGGGKGFDFTKIAGGACVRDNVTGLVWESKVNDVRSLHYMGWTYTWYDSAHNYYGNPGTPGGGVCGLNNNVCDSRCLTQDGLGCDGVCTIGFHCDTEKFVADVNAEGLCGYRDWRVPTVRELQSIVDYGRLPPAIDPDFFPNTNSSNFPNTGSTFEFIGYWTSSPSPADPNYAVSLAFGLDSSLYVHIDSRYRSNRYFVRLVRGGF